MANGADLSGIEGAAQTGVRRDVARLVNTPVRIVSGTEDDLTPDNQSLAAVICGFLRAAGPAVWRRASAGFHRSDYHRSHRVGSPELLTSTFAHGGGLGLAR